VEFAGLLIPVDIFNFLVGEYHLSHLYQKRTGCPEERPGVAGPHILISLPKQTGFADAITP